MTPATDIRSSAKLFFQNSTDVDTDMQDETGSNAKTFALIASPGCSRRTATRRLARADRAFMPSAECQL